MYNFFGKALKLRNINRWALMHNTQTEDVSQHSFEVAVIANGIAAYGVAYFHRTYSVGRVTEKALFHDITESVTGDLCTPVKYANEHICRAYKELERQTLNALVLDLSWPLSEYYTDLLLIPEIDVYIDNIIKAADTIAAIIKCRREISMGNTEFLEAEKTLQEELKGFDLPEVIRFWEENKDSLI